MLKAWDPVFAITISENIAHGTVTVQESVLYGENVALTAEPEEGYWLSAVRLYDESHQLILETGEWSGSFVMPGHAVTVEAEFKTKKDITTDILYPFAGFTLHTHGTLTADKQIAGGGETVALTLETEESYGLKTGGMTAYAYLNDVRQNALTVTEQADGTWTFDMPAGDYTAKAFAEIEWKNAPPSGSSMPYFYIDEACTAHGTVSAGSVPTLNPPLSPDNLYRPSVTQITLTAEPATDYVLKGWEVVTVNASGEPAFGYSLPVERYGNSSNYIVEFNTVDNNYIFRIRAIFEEAPQLITIDVSVSDKPGTINTPHPPHPPSIPP